MSEANETIFNNWKDFIHRESERIITQNLEHKPYDSLKSQEIITVISQQVLMLPLRSSKNCQQLTKISSTSSTSCFWPREAMALILADLRTTM
jgi:hypothetical protein